ncbi:HIT family hydrolase [candidate division LCP-89 bacterium B3_LCP]|uniref:HIT family hydrolase n=1 Tax=candidate division LCP-89 bacterium B3_LCP TaxID=2012998 RepID=A0A532UUA9_UNCL8|nr:MAG: HIT family hydrolase [candidate division LCP-89 bacterium B3_LCP]
MTEKDKSEKPPFEGDQRQTSGHIIPGRLWAPWRMKYIQAAAAGEEPDCFLCEYQQMEDNENNLILHRGKTCFVIMNLYPYNNGHLMVAPCRHIDKYSELTTEEIAEAGELTKLSLRALHETMHPHGYNVGWNLGRVAGAGVEEHIHQHIVPRWDGDTNFMPVIGNTKVISESLHEGYRRLRSSFARKKK